MKLIFDRLSNVLPFTLSLISIYFWIATTSMIFSDEFAWNTLSNHLQLPALQVAIKRGLIRLLAEDSDGVTKDVVLSSGIFGPIAYNAFIPVLITDGFITSLDNRLYLTAVTRQLFTSNGDQDWSACAEEYASKDLVQRFIDNIEIELGQPALRDTLPAPRNWSQQEHTLNPTILSNFLKVIHSNAATSSKLLAPIMRDIGVGNVVLDIGGGSGRYTTELNNLNIRCILAEIPAVVRTFDSLEFDYNREMELVFCDALNSIPNGFDSHLFADVIHMFDRPQALRILRNSYESLKPGGKIFLSNTLIPDDPSSNRNSNYLRLFMFYRNVGRSYSASEFRELLEEASFCNVRFIPYHSHYTLVWAQKPQ